jgi:hypothetical protein
MTDEELVERLKRYFGPDHTMNELELIDVVRGATGTDPVTARARVHSLIGTALVSSPPKDGYRFAP